MTFSFRHHGLGAVALLAAAAAGLTCSDNTTVLLVGAGSRDSFLAVTSDDPSAQPDGRLVIIEAARRVPVACIPLSIEGAFDVAVTPDGTRAYVTSAANDSVSVVDLVNRVELRTIQLLPPRGDRRLFGIAIHPDGTRAYVASWASGEPFGDQQSASDRDEVVVLDLTTSPEKVLRRIPGIPKPTFPAISADGRFVYVPLHLDSGDSCNGPCNPNALGAKIIDTSFDDVVETLSGGPNEQLSAAASPDGSMFWITFEDLDTGAGVSTDGYAAFSTIPPFPKLFNVPTTPNSSSSAPFADSRGIAVGPDGTVFVATESHRVAVIDPGTGEEVRRIGPANADLNRIYVNRDGGTVYVTTGDRLLFIDPTGARGTEALILGAKSVVGFNGPNLGETSPCGPAGTVPVPD